MLIGCSRSDPPPAPKQSVAKAPVQEEPKATDTDAKQPADQAKLPNKSPPRPEFRRGKIKKIDVDRMIVTLTIAEQDQEFRVTNLTFIHGGSGSSPKERLAGFKEGAEVSFRSGQAGGEAVFLNLTLLEGLPGP